MVQFSNVISCSANEVNDEYILYFKQQTPNIDNDGKVASSNDETVASVVMTKNTARALRNLLNNIIKE